MGKALAVAGIPREELFVTTKVWNTDRGYDATLKAFEESRKKLHGLRGPLPCPLAGGPGPEGQWQQTQDADTWRALETLYVDGKVRAIGVSKTSSRTIWNPSWTRPRSFPW